MKRAILTFLACAAGLAGGGYALWNSLPVRHAAGVRIAPKAPLQQPLQKPIAAFDFKGFHFQPIAEFFVTARVLSKRKYYDDTSSIAPVDLALGWGVMSDQAILDKLKISQTFRFYFYEFEYPSPAPQAELQSSSSNMHLIASTDSIRAAIGRVRVGEVVHFTGYLVNVSNADGMTWNSSTRREDSGKGACEIVWVSKFDVVPASN